MPKKFAGENSKAAAARARKEAVKADEATRKKQAEEDEFWRDDDKGNARKLQRKEEAERKRAEAQQRKQENRLAHDEEMKQLVGKAAAIPKVTQAAIESTRLAEVKKMEAEAEERVLAESKIEVEKEVEENVNRLETDGEVARSVVEAISILSTNEPTVDRHPEKRMKAAYQAFEEKMLPLLKEEHPTFRLSQLKQVLKKEWQKSPENPLNQRILNIVQ